MDVPEMVAGLEVESDGVDAFIGRSPADRDRPVYGGQFLAQAVTAAAATVEKGRLPHSLHAYFVRSGAPRTPIRYVVERVRDGRNFSHRSVVAEQEGREVFRQVMSFQVPTEGPSHQEPTGVTSGVEPGVFPEYREWVAELSDNRGHDWFKEDVPVEIRFEDPPPARPRRAVTGQLRIWMRVAEPVPSDDPLVHAALLAWMSDKTISDVTMYPHGRSWTDVGTDILSLDHAMWFYQVVRADEWLLLTHETPLTGAGRGLARGDLITHRGDRVGALAQEALLLISDPDG